MRRLIIELENDNTSKMTLRPAKTQCQPANAAVCPDAKGVAKDTFLGAKSEDSDQTAWLIGVFPLRACDFECFVVIRLLSFTECTPRVPIDIVFAVDSAAIGASNTKFVLEFIGNISGHLDMEAGEVTIATISNGCNDGNFDETPSSDPETIKKGLSNYHAPKFDQLMRNMRLKAGDGRLQSKHVGIVFVSDRLSPYDLRKSSLEAKRARFQKIGIFVVGIGNHVEDSQLETLTTEDTEFFRAFGFESLSDVGNALLYRLCLYGTTKN